MNEHKQDVSLIYYSPFLTCCQSSTLVPFLHFHHARPLLPDHCLFSSISSLMKKTQTATKARPTSSLKRPSPVNTGTKTHASARNGHSSIPTQVRSMGHKPPRVSIGLTCPSSCHRVVQSRLDQDCVQIVIVGALCLFFATFLHLHDIL